MADVKTMFNEVSTNLRQMGVRVTLKYIARTKDPKVRRIYHTEYGMGVRILSKPGDTMGLRCTTTPRPATSTTLSSARMRRAASSRRVRPRSVMRCGSGGG
jgi:hypothetical protein